ncbi:hypothetical protein [Actinokineospora globicatena]|uniref:hypothetical protein n=1 Tax=Actinokineospora globicatena TaxID=103729 RepID=UPI0020A4F0AD|nr:hypothetical protein [Actinokineospora globicatena]MCP2303876.1 hypothetical protein [Actinokineospora globicatena]GLW78966.1 hypothetical protein Aglo01_34480 [Actinokineospora globicatena]GLW86623.1 hypothetical protein Aglo02_42620 [Actinokineospora globicatena]
MIPLNLDRINFHERLVFVRIVVGQYGLPKAAYVIDGRDYADAEQARAAVLAALQQTSERMQLADFTPSSIRSSETELALWPSWTEFRQYLDVYGPVYPWPKPVPVKVHPSAGPMSDVPLPPMYDGVHFETWGQLVKIFPRGGGPIDPVFGVRVEAYALNGFTGEIEANTRNAVLVARNVDNEGETWPLTNEDEFIARVESRRERLLHESGYHRRDAPEIFAAYEQAARDGTTEQTRHATYEMWRQHQLRRAYFIIDSDPVRVDLSDDGIPTMAWRLDTTTGRIIATDQADAETVVTGPGTRVTQEDWIVRIEEIRRTLDPDREIAEVYAAIDADGDDWSRKPRLHDSFRLWAEKFVER